MSLRRSGPRLRVGVVAQHYPPHVGGLEVVAERVARGLAERGHDVDVLTSADPAPVGRTVEAGGVAVHRVRAGTWLERFGVPFPFFSPVLLTQAWRMARRCDVVQVHDMLYLSSWVVALACRLTRTPYVVTQHVGMVDHPSRIVRAAQVLVLRTVGAMVLRGAAQVLPISPVIEQWLQEALPGVRTRVLRNGVDGDLFRPADVGEKEEIRRRFGLPSDEVLVLYVGRFVPKKGFTVVSSAAGEDYRLVFVGGGRPRGVDDCSERIFLGALPPGDTAAVYRACDVFVCASVGEGPMTPMEAMLSGCAVLVNDDPAMRALHLADGVEELAMTADRLKSRLTTLARDPEALEALRARSREVAMRLPTWDTYLAILEEVLAQTPRAADERWPGRPNRLRPKALSDE
jgi:D-inositol-3-phosphate glycosyltransferase